MKTIKAIYSSYDGLLVNNRYEVIDISQNGVTIVNQFAEVSTFPVWYFDMGSLIESGE